MAAKADIEAGSEQSSGWARHFAHQCFGCRLWGFHTFEPDKCRGRGSFGYPWGSAAFDTDNDLENRPGKIIRRENTNEKTVNFDFNTCNGYDFIH